ncbi:MAG: hypothetical protein ACI9WC_003347 [Arenicella sp.]
MFFLLLLAYVSCSFSQQSSNIISLNSNGKLVLGDSHVYAKRSVQSTIALSDEVMRDRNAQYIVRDALKGNVNSTTAFNIDFAPGAAVMTASGRRKVEIIADAMIRVDPNLSFLIHVAETNGRANQPRLNQARAREIVSYMPVKQSIKNRLIVPEKSDPLFVANSSKNPDATQNVIFESLGEAVSQLSPAKLEGPKLLKNELRFN